MAVMNTPNDNPSGSPQRPFDDPSSLGSLGSPFLTEDKTRQQISIQGSGIGNRALKTPVETLATIPADGHKITHLASKFFSVMMECAQKQGAPNAEGGFEASLSEVYQRAQYTSRNIKYARETIKSLVSTLVEWQSPTSAESNQWGVTSMISQAIIETSKSGSTLKWWYSPKILHQVLDPHPYAKVNLDIMFELNSYSAEMLYKICCRYVSSETGLTPRKDWKWWHDVLVGSAEKGRAEAEFKVFNRSVLKKAIDAINLKSNIHVDAIYFKNGVKVTDIQFMARRKAVATAPGVQIKTEAHLKLVGRALSAGIAQSEIEAMLPKLPEPVISEALDVLEKRVTQLPKVDRPFDYFKKVAENVGSEKGKLSFDATSGQEIDQKAENRTADYRKTVVLTAYRDAKRQEAYELYGESIESDKATVLTMFRATLSESLKKSFDKNSVQSNMLMGLFKQYLVEEAFGPDWGKPGPDVLHDFFIRNVDKIKL